MDKAAFALAVAAGLLAIAAAAPAAASLPKAKAPVTACATGPALGGPEDCRFTCAGPSAGSHGAGRGELTVTCGSLKCTVQVPAMTGCDLLGLRGRTAGRCTFTGVGAAACQSR